MILEENMRKKLQIVQLTICLVLVLVVSACSDNLYKTNALLNIKPVDYSEGMIEDGTYLKALRELSFWGANPQNVDYPTLDHLLYLYIGDYQGSGNPPHSLLIDFKIDMIFYCKHLDLLRGNYADQMVYFELEESDSETITSFESVQNIIKWKSHYDASGGDRSWVVTLYFDDGSFFQSGGGFYPDVYIEFEEEIWPFIQEKTGDEFWWMR
jgi:hypothetical protein